MGLGMGTGDRMLFSDLGILNNTHSELAVEGVLLGKIFRMIVYLTCKALWIFETETRYKRFLSITEMSWD